MATTGSELKYFTLSNIWLGCDTVTYNYLTGSMQVQFKLGIKSKFFDI